MSEEKAITTLEIIATNLIGDVQNGNELGTMNYKAIDKAIQALQEKAEREKQPNGWIPVTERLPEVETNVLIRQHFTETGPYADVTIGHLHQPSDLRRKPYWTWIAYGADMGNPKIEAFHRSDFICPGEEFVTYWQPLPEPYKAVEE